MRMCDMAQACQMALGRLGAAGPGVASARTSRAGAGSAPRAPPGVSSAADARLGPKRRSAAARQHVSTNSRTFSEKEAASAQHRQAMAGSCLHARKPELGKVLRKGSLGVRKGLCDRTGVQNQPIRHLRAKQLSVTTRKGAPSCKRNNLCGPRVERTRSAARKPYVRTLRRGTRGCAPCGDSGGALGGAATPEACAACRVSEPAKLYSPRCRRLCCRLHYLR
jgi:hypothetical protein